MSTKKADAALHTLNTEARIQALEKQVAELLQSVRDLEEREFVINLATRAGVKR